MRMAFVCSWAGMLLLLATSAVFSQNAGQAPPALPPVGTEIEYLDARGALKKGKFVELLPNGAVKVRLEDGSTRLMPPNRVRLAGGAAAPADKPMAVKPVGEAPGDQPAGKPPAAESGLRTWIDTTGMFKIEATFVALADGQVELKKADGKTLKLPLAKLSASDQKTAEALAAAMSSPKPPAEGDPFAANTRPIPASPAPLTATPVAPTQRREPGRASEPKELTIVNPATAPQILFAAPAEWAVKVDPPVSPPPKIADRFEAIPSTDPSELSTFWDVSTGAAFDPVHNWMWASLSYGELGRRSGKFERVDLMTGKLLAPIHLPLTAKPLAISPSGTLLATMRCKENGNGDQDHLDLWSLNGDTLTAVHSFKPFTGKINISGRPYHVDWCEFLDDRYFLTGHDYGLIVLWDLQKMTPVYQINFTSGQAALSPGRKQLAIAAMEGVFVLEALTGKVLGQPLMTQKQVGGLLGTGIAFNEDGTQLACVASAYVHVWNVADGKVTKSFPTSGASGGALSFSPDSQYLVCGHQDVIDVNSGHTLFGYSYTEHGGTYAGREFLLMATQGKGTKIHEVVPFVVYHPEIIKRAVANIEKFQLKPGEVGPAIHGLLNRDGISFFR